MNEVVQEVKSFPQRRLCMGKEILARRVWAAREGGFGDLGVF